LLFVVEPGGFAAPLATGDERVAQLSGGETCIALVAVIS
jgi:hypothetical protein